MASQTSITYEGLDEIIESFANADSNVHRVGKSFLRDLSIYGVKQVQIQLLNIGAVDTNELIQGIHYELSSTGLESVIKPSEKADGYAAAIEYGSKPHWPPISALEGWAERHGIPAFLVARKIAREGTEARPYMQPAYEDLDRYTQGELQGFAEELIRWL